MLTKEQIESFKKDGVLIIRDFFSPEEISTWKEEVHEYHQNPKSHEDWQNEIIKSSSTSFKLDDEPTPVTHPKLKKLYECLYQETNWQGDNELVARWPEIDAEWLGARTPHLDFPVYAQIRALVNLVFYLNDVTPTGAPFMYWNESHKVAWDHFRNTPKDYMAQGELSQGQVFEILANTMETEPIAFSGKAGDLLLWHSLTLHSASVNISNEARLAIFGRWGSAIESNESHFNFSEGIWDKWNLMDSN
jgi:hypothetical protein